MNTITKDEVLLKNLGLFSFSDPIQKGRVLKSMDEYAIQYLKEFLIFTTTCNMPMPQAAKVFNELKQKNLITP